LWCRCSWVEEMISMCVTLRMRTVCMVCVRDVLVQYEWQNDDLGRMWNKWRYHLSTCLERLRKVRTLPQELTSLWVKILNLTPEYDAGMPTIKLWCSIASE
jgi:hypothetical protein